MFRKKFASRISGNGGLRSSRIDWCCQRCLQLSVCLWIFKAKCPWDMSILPSKKTHLTKMATRRKTTRSLRRETTRIWDGLPVQTPTNILVKRSVPFDWKLKLSCCLDYFELFCIICCFSADGGQDYAVCNFSISQEQDTLTIYLH